MLSCISRASWLGLLVHPRFCESHEAPNTSLSKVIYQYEDGWRAGAVRRYVLALMLLAAVVAADLWFLFRRHPVEETGSPQIDSVPSPDGDHSVLITREAGITHVWLQSQGEVRSLVSRLNPDESARNVTWSPDGRLAAFETYNSDGHSPMTTTHVQVLDPYSGGLQEVRLPPPNERYSTHFVEWAGNDILRIRSTLLDRPEDHFFVYYCHTGEIRDGAD
jgi:hypothetical protein